MSFQQLDATQIVSDTLISTTQVISQSLAAQQKLEVDCQDKAPCQACQTLQSKYSAVDCTVLCQCTVADVDMSQSITCDFTAIATMDQKVFNDTFLNNLYLASLNKGVSISNLSVKTDVLMQNLENVLTTMQSTNFQSSIQSLVANQDVRLIGPGTIMGVNMQQISKVVMNSLQESSDLSSVLTDLQTTMIAICSEITMSAIDQLIAIFLMIISVLLILLLTIFTCQNILSLLTAL